MNVLMVLGSPRKNSNSAILAQSVMQGIADGGGTCEAVRLAKLDVHPCLGCGGCEKEGRCVINDDMQSLYEKIVAADRIVIVSPIYFYGVTAQAKAFIDRCQALWSRKYLLKQRIRGAAPRIGYLVSVSATRGERIFEGAILTVRYGLDAMDCSYGGELLVRGVDKKGEMAGRCEELARAREFGRLVVEAKNSGAEAV